MPCSMTPVAPRTPGHCGVSVLPSAVQTAWATATSSFSGLNRTACVLAVYASRRGSPPAAQDSLPAGGQPCPDGVGYPQGSSEEFRTYMAVLPSQVDVAHLSRSNLHRPFVHEMGAPVPIALMR